jgi:hypothetical protein
VIASTSGTRRVDAALALQGTGPRAAGEHRLLRAPIRAVVAVPGGSNAVWEFQLPDGGSAFVKPMGGVDARLARQYGHDVTSTILAEYAASRLAGSLGEPYATLVPVVALRRLVEVSGEQIAAVLAHVPGDPAHVARALAGGGPAVRRAAFFDALVGQQDRNLSNMLADRSGRVIRLIDHGYTFAVPGACFNARGFDQGQGVGTLDEPDRAACRNVLGSPDLFGLAPLLGHERADAVRARARRMLRTNHLIPRGQF